METPLSYTLFKLVTKDVLVKSTDYYARSGDSQESTIQTLEFIESFEEQGQAVEHLRNLKESTSEDYLEYIKGDYTILPIFTI